MTKFLLIRLPVAFRCPSEIKMVFNLLVKEGVAIALLVMDVSPQFDSYLQRTGFVQRSEVRTIGKCVIIPEFLVELERRCSPQLNTLTICFNTNILGECNSMLVSVKTTLLNTHTGLNSIVDKPDDHSFDWVPECNSVAYSACV